MEDLVQGKMTDYQRIGGEPALRPVIERFVQRIFDDWVIGFHFAGKDQARITRFELQHASRVLGAPIPYEGRPIAPLHKPLRINRGQFRRRLAILRQVAEQAGFDPEVIDRWIAREQLLEPVVTDGTDCVPEPRAQG